MQCAIGCIRSYLQRGGAGRWRVPLARLPVLHAPRWTVMTDSRIASLQQA
ncbi:hypothetical protein [Enterobacter hormaechei]|nr:hypothetical protein [Enterobacter hormaechei]